MNFKHLFFVAISLLLFINACDDDPSNGPSTNPSSSDTLMMTTLSAINDSADSDTITKSRALTNNIDYTNTFKTMTAVGTFATDTVTSWYDLTLTYNSYTNTNETPEIVFTGTTDYDGTCTATSLALKYTGNLTTVSYKGTNYALSFDIDYTYTLNGSTAHLTYKGTYTLDGSNVNVNLALDF